MALGKGLESLIPPQEPNQSSNQPQKDWGAGERALSEPPTSGDPTTPTSEAVQQFEQTREVVFQIEADKIRPNPHQPRRNFDEGSLRELADSIREFGIIQPLVVSKIEEEKEDGRIVYYQLLVGERRLLAAKMLGLSTVPVIVKDVPPNQEKLELAIVENIQRADLNPIELARAIAKLQEEFRLTQREIASRLGKSRESIANNVRLLTLPSAMQEAVASKRVNESQARLLLAVSDSASRERLFEEILKDNLTVREVSRRVRQIKAPVADAPGASGELINPEILALKEELESLLGAPVKLKNNGGRGQLAIKFYSEDELRTILDKIIRERRTF